MFLNMLKSAYFYERFSQMFAMINVQVAAKINKTIIAFIAGGPTYLHTFLTEAQAPSQSIGQQF